jgi:hypothetical protein
MDKEPVTLDANVETSLAASLFNGVWTLLSMCEANDIGDFDLAFCYEALARAHAVAGDFEEARRWLQRGSEAANDVAEEDDREILLADLASVQV